MVEKQDTVFGSEKKPYVKPEFEVIELDNQTPLLAGSPSGKATFGNGGSLGDEENWSDD